MFNRNPNMNRRQFHTVDDDLDVAMPSSGPNTHAKGESIPFAGGTFNVHKNLLTTHGERGTPIRVDHGAFITRSAQTVLPGTLSKGERYAEFNSTPEQGRAIINDWTPASTTAGDPGQHIGITEEQLLGGGSEVSAAVGHTELYPVSHENLGGAIRDLRAKAAAQRVEEDGGVAGFTMREWNALDEEGMTRRHFE
jgi:hypothetical protein